MLTGILHPTSGSIKVMGNLNPIEDRNEYTQNIGVVFGQRSILAYDIPVRDSFRLFKAIYGLSEEFYQKRVAYLVEMLGIEPFFETPYRMLSLGEKMRCELAASFLHKPKIVFLDEPTIGLDAQAKIVIRTFLKKINKEEEVTIMITTHDMDDIEELCQRIVVIDKGTLAYEGSVKKFKETYANAKDVTIHYKKIVDKDTWSKLKETIPNRKNDIPKSIIFEFPMNKSLGKFLQDVVKSIEIHDLSIQEPNLEHIIADMYNQATSEKKENVLKKESEIKRKK
jgi:ABC-2 type transport system ATP-binding protein